MLPPRLPCSDYNLKQNEANQQLILLSLKQPLGSLQSYLPLAVAYLRALPWGQAPFLIAFHLLDISSKAKKPSPPQLHQNSLPACNIKANRLAHKRGSSVSHCFGVTSSGAIQLPEGSVLFKLGEIDDRISAVISWPAKRAGRAVVSFPAPLQMVAGEWRKNIKFCAVFVLVQRAWKKQIVPLHWLRSVVALPLQ